MNTPRPTPRVLDSAVRACTPLAAILAAGAVWALVAPAQAAETAEVKRGRYLVEQVGMCADCHSARDQKGQIVKATNLQGAPIGFKPLMEMPWGDVAPPIAGLPSGWTRAQFVTFMTTGKRPDGSLPRPPMPEYRLDAADAGAVAAYLQSLR